VDVAAPEVAVQPRRRLVRPGELLDPGCDRLDRAHAGGPQRAAVGRHPRRRQQPVGGVERRPAAGRLVRQRERPEPQQRRVGRARRQRAGRLRPGLVQERETAPEMRLVGAPAALDPLERQEVVADRQDVRHGQRSGAGQPAQARGLGGEGAWNGIRSGLDERAPPVLEHGRVGVVEVAAGHAPQLRDRRAERGGERVPHTRPSARSSSSSPRHAASTRSSTCSKPSSPP
jgi:hypothetical protein